MKPEVSKRPRPYRKIHFACYYPFAWSNCPLFFATPGSSEDADGLDPISLKLGLPVQSVCGDPGTNELTDEITDLWQLWMII